MKRFLLPATFAAIFLLATGAPALADFDGDGIDPPMDCNDNDNQVYPGAFEIVGDGIDENCDAQETCYQDIDNDGVRTNLTVVSTDTDCADSGEAMAFDTAGDCDDNNSARYPGATEIVGDGVDEDCNAQELCYGDMDNDGARTTGAILSSDLDCSDAYEGQASDQLDCDDGNASAYPGGTEVCDASNVDEDCDGNADDNDPEGAVGKSSWYGDVDGDGYGDAFGPVTQACDAPPSSSSNGLDCNDGSAAINPDANEACDAMNVDEDCDGQADDADGGGATGKIAYYDDNDADGYGGAMHLQCDQISGQQTSGGDCDDAHATAHPGGTETCSDTYDNDCNGQADCLDSACTADAACLVTVVDHIECYKIKTTEKLKATINLDPGTNPPFAQQNGCTIKKASKFCIPVMKTVSTLESNLTPNPTYQGVEQTDMRVCYKMKCPDQTIPLVTVKDQFGTRTFEKFKVTEVCTPAEIVP